MTIFLFSPDSCSPDGRLPLVLHLLQFDAFVVVVQLVGPVAHSPDVEGEGAFLFWGRANGERVPLEGGYLRDLDLDPVPWAVLEVFRFSDHQLSHPRRKDIALTNLADVSVV